MFTTIFCFLIVREGFAIRKSTFSPSFVLELKVFSVRLRQVLSLLDLRTTASGTQNSTFSPQNGAIRPDYLNYKVPLNSSSVFLITIVK